ncbi:succinylglutamate desuccinylase/aspartoacylase family protein [Flagellimonas aequoris]|uniref:Peptidase M14 n=1 Tax=Flagellimonas aequoris TaxID=2306997 RepID=A0A418N5N3_9FLAO|nr:succinylglutamate desuccinylase/aspartoacylase family protein [Allomuricauda aequoris]RIV69544.1 peptidase M14 [Allomuricauda aequoris]TXK01141.1 succinylglutamate desuccinylase/aspartoacylase family protein [Allomuricauda aequoris]
MKTKVFACFFLICSALIGQNKYPIVDQINLSDYKAGTINNIWLQLGDDGFSNPILIPVIIAKGFSEGEVIGLTASIHGNELNGIPIIQNVIASLDAAKMKGTVVAIPGLNPLAIANTQREFIDLQDLNRLFPGKKDGNRSQQMAYQIAQKVIPLFNYHVDLHTASFGRVNSLYGRGDMQEDTLSTMLRILEPDIIVSNKGVASFGEASGLTMRAYAISKGVKSITLEYGNPQVYQQDMIERGTKGVTDLFKWLGFTQGTVTIPPARNVCSKSYWIFTQKGGYLDVLVDLGQKVKKGDPIGILKDPFGEVVEEVNAPEDGIVIGKSSNPVNISGGRIIHLGILE